MDIRTYQIIYKRLNSPEDVQQITKEFSLYTSTIFNILHQKTVRNVRKYHSRMVQKAPALVRSWKRGNSIMKIAQQNNFPPVLTATIMLKEMGLKSKSVIKNPDILDDKRLKKDIELAIDCDFCFSPKAHSHQSGHGKLGEEFIHAWLEQSGVDFLTENDLARMDNGKTPDFLLHEPIEIADCQVNWIESKAVFADDKEHNRYQKKQFQFYEGLYGPGMVVYWYGFLDTIIPTNYIITDHTFFQAQGADVDVLLDHKVNW